MIYSYGVSLPGTYHIKEGIVCQDAHQILHCGEQMAIAAVADGLGSAKHSDVGSKIAASVATEYCGSKLTGETDKTQILDIIRASFTAALRAIEKEANEKDRPVDLYDTTLTLAVLVRDMLYYGHSGDSGMIALTAQGLYEPVTAQQRDEEGRVFPLFFSDRWEFAEYGQAVAAVLLATDGMLESFFPVYIKNEPVKIHVSLARFFMDNRTLCINELGQEAIQEAMAEYIENIPAEQVNDDKTIAVLINTAVKTKLQPEDYYKEPDWAALKKKYDDEWRRAAYPGLYKQEEPSSNPQENQQENPEVADSDAPKIESVTISKPRNKKGLRVLLLVIAAAGICGGSLAAFFGMWPGPPPPPPMQELPPLPTPYTTSPSAISVDHIVL